MWNDDNGDVDLSWGAYTLLMVIIGTLAGGIVALVLLVVGIMFPILMPWVVVSLVAGPACGLAYAIAVK